MDESPRPSDDLEFQQARVYFDPSSGEVKHVHTLVAAHGETLDPQRVGDEMRAFEESLQARHEMTLEHVVVDSDDLGRMQQAGVTPKVDLGSKRLVLD
jgi:hypothetical protein